MRSTRHAARRFSRTVYSSLFLLLLTLLTPALVARAADDDPEEPDEYDVTARVVRISLLAGEVNLRRAGKTDSERVRLNLPLVEGDTVTTENEARVEIQIDARNFVRVGSSSILKIVTLRDDGIALSLVAGTASIRLAKFDQNRESFEIDAPKTTLTVEKNGLYRIDVGKDGGVRLTARDGGRARIYSETSGFALRDGRAAELITAGPDAGEWEMIAANGPDSWDDWNTERERYLAERLRYDKQYYDDDVWGAEDLDAYGSWTSTSEYGWIWRPHATAISSYEDWAPYRYGEWTWVPPYGWTWIGNEPWGWAPYHYGRWVYHNNYWAWVPHTKVKARRSWWRPALVAFLSIDFSFGNEVCWYPLSYHDRDPRARNYHHDRDDRSSGRDRDRRDHRRDDRWRGLTSLPTRDFGGAHPRTRPVEERVARRIADAEPLRNFPVTPRHETRPTGSTATDRRRAQTDGDDRRREWSERRTGAANRNPGVPLENELRRTRVWNGREARTPFPVATGGAEGLETRPTGAVVRPEPARREVDSNPPGNELGNASADNNSGDSESSRERRERPARASRTADHENVMERAPVHQPMRVPATSEGSPAETSVGSGRDHRPTETNNSPTRPATAHREERREGSEARPARSERNGESRREAQNNPPPPEPAPERSETIRQEAPRNDPPPPPSPEPRNDPPPRSEPAPQQSSPAKNDAPPPESPRHGLPKDQEGNDLRKKDPR